MADIEGMRQIDTRHGRVAVHVSGAGAPVVLLHGSPGDHRDYEAVLPRLAAHHRVIAVDWPAYGASPAPEEPRRTTAPDLAGALRDLVDVLGLDRASYIGNAVGGYAAACLAIEAPTRVSALVLVNSAGFGRANAATRTLGRLHGTPTATRLLSLPTARFGNPRPNAYVTDLLGRYAAALTDPAAVAVQSAVRRSLARPDTDLRERAAAIRAPTLLAWGRRDRIAGARDAWRAARAVPGARLVLLDAGRVAFAANPAAFLAAVLPFLARHGG
ncbi:alpha/beta fold hydrolase [Streptomyces sp. H27-C3]|uniref:alpha/beta fold hydrolase n=1 Tax=Streptomyces sp. H27-C3 TaxID=3046305 RepID=UPI0024BABD26|nr:alpha/beta fold hydrolase [Streptomyces sp. H27-C3]MDJ0461633.1 alpha/beta fold hydrolase [Streptomyces sp. H27-C3]